MLDKNKSYVFWTVGKGVVSQYIQRHGRRQLGMLPAQYRAAPFVNKDEVKENVLAVHCGLVRHEDDGWMFYESHAKTHGVHRCDYDKWQCVNNHDPIVFFEANVAFDKAAQLLSAKTPYSMVDIRALLVKGVSNAMQQLIRQKANDIIALSLPPDKDNGMICSEYVASCVSDITDFYTLPCHSITPILIQNYAFMMHLQHGLQLFASVSSKDAKLTWLVQHPNLIYTPIEWSTKDE